VRNIQRSILVLVLAVLLSACDGKVGYNDYFTHNISAWNNAIYGLNKWTEGEQGQRFFESIEKRKGMTAIISHMKSARNEVAHLLASTETYPYPSDAEDVNTKLVSLLKEVIAVYDVMLKMDALPDGFSNAQIEPLQAEYDRLMTSLDEKAKLLDKAQQAYADKHGIALSRSGG
jgi:hypothetical protein